MSILIDNIKYVKNRRECIQLYTSCLFIIHPHCSEYLRFNLSLVNSLGNLTHLVVNPVFHTLKGLLSSPSICFEGGILSLYVHNPYNEEIVIESGVNVGYISKYEML